MMLADALLDVPCEQITKGVELYKFTTDTAVAKGEYNLNLNPPIRRWLSLFFCQDGVIILHRRHCADIEITREEIALFTDISDIVSFVVQESPVGYCLLIDPASCTIFSNIFQMIGHGNWNYEEMQAVLQKHGGYLRIKNSTWQQSVFSTLSSLPNTEQGNYCVLKAVELCYMLHARQSVYDRITQQSSMPDYLVDQLNCIGNYIENHLDEKLTISSLCHRFHLSPTALKNKFREFYGQSIHNWIQYRRVHRASELLKSTNMTVLQIAQSVGYESVSQFNVIFRRFYGTTPSLYKKMSNIKRF